MNPLNHILNTADQSLVVAQNINTSIHQSLQNITNTAQEAIGRAQENLNENQSTLKCALNVPLQSARVTIDVTQALASSTFTLANASLEVSRSLIGRIQR